MLHPETDREARTRRAKTEQVLVASMLSWAREQGLAAWRDEPRLKAQFPGVPEIFITQVSMQLDSDEADAFLDQLGKTVEAEIIRRAINDSGGGA